jgi:hypothetical protein
LPAVFEPYVEEHVPAVADFNRRLAAAGVAERFPESPVPRWLPRSRSDRLFQEFFVLRDAEAVRGAYILKHQPFFVAGETVSLADYQLPISEGRGDPRFALVGLLTLKDALRRKHLIFGLGAGGFQEPVTRLLQTLRFELVACPFFFRVVSPNRFLRQITFLRSRPVVRLALDAAAFTGAGWAGLRLAHAVKTRPLPASQEYGAEIAPAFGAWADAIWEEAKHGYSVIAVRDQAMLDVLYPERESRFIRMRVTRRGRPVGWAVLLDTEMKNHRQFGDMRVGSVVDCLALPGEERAVVALSTRHLAHAGVDLIVSNQLHDSWVRAFRCQGYLEAPSNFIFFSSPRLTEKVAPFETSRRRIHMTRGDGDGPIHL